MSARAWLFGPDAVLDKISEWHLSCYVPRLVTDTRSANRALYVSVTHGRHSLRRLSKDELDRQREGSMRELLFSLPSFDKADKGTFLRGLQM